jgi:hypothetical protein
MNKEKLHVEVEQSKSSWDTTIGRLLKVLHLDSKKVEDGTTRLEHPYFAMAVLILLASVPAVTIGIYRKLRKLRPAKEE